MMKRILLTMIAFATLTGCAAKSPFVYDHPTAIPEPVQGGIVAAVAPVSDERMGGKEIDKVFSGEPLEEIQATIQKELMRTGLFQEISRLSEKSDVSNADMLIEPSLMEMKWEVPNYDEILGTAFMTSFLTGGIGGMIYGSTETDVYGHTTLKVRILDSADGHIILEKTYDGRCEEKVVKLSCDTPATKATMAGDSLKRAIDMLKADLKAAVRENEVHAKLQNDNL